MAGNGIRIQHGLQNVDRKPVDEDGIAETTKRALVEAMAENQDLPDDDADTLRRKEKTRRELVRLARRESYRGRFKDREGENCRSNVSMRIERALQEIGKENKELFRYLRANITRGLNCSYKPENWADWQL